MDLGLYRFEPFGVDEDLLIWGIVSALSMLLLPTLAALWVVLSLERAEREEQQRGGRKGERLGGKILEIDFHRRASRRRAIKKVS